MHSFRSLEEKLPVLFSEVEIEDVLWGKFAIQSLLRERNQVPHVHIDPFKPGLRESCDLLLQRYVATWDQ